MQGYKVMVNVGHGPKDYLWAVLDEETGEVVALTHSSGEAYKMAAA